MYEMAITYQNGWRLTNHGYNNLERVISLGAKLRVNPEIDFVDIIDSETGVVLVTWDRIGCAYADQKELEECFKRVVKLSFSSTKERGRASVFRKHPTSVYHILESLSTLF